jgi:hypothetical protein
MGAVLCETAPSTVTVLTATVRDFTTIIVTLFRAPSNQTLDRVQ